MEDRHARTKRLIGEDALLRLHATHIAVVGLGGVGGVAAEALCRSGLGMISLYDGDCVACSNLNRQIIATEETIGTNKADAAAERLKSINADITIRSEPEYVTESELNRLFADPPDLIVDAIDRVPDKVSLIVFAHERRIPILSAGGAGNRIEPGCIEIKDIYQTTGDPLCRVLRRELKKRGVQKHLVAVCERLPMTTQRPAASMMFAPAMMGLSLAAQAIRMVLEEIGND